jgi:hypothetical protein
MSTRGSYKAISEVVEKKLSSSMMQQDVMWDKDE